MDDDELLRVLKRIAQQESSGDPRWRRPADEPLPDGESDGRDGLTTRPRAALEPREARAPLDDETRARLAERLAAQLRDARAEAPPSSLARPMPMQEMRERRSGIRVRSLPVWDIDTEEPAIPHGGRLADGDGSLYGTGIVPLDTAAPVCRSIGDGSEPPRDAHPDETEGRLVERAAAVAPEAAAVAGAAAASPAGAAAASPAGAAARPAGAAAPLEGRPCPELAPRRPPLRARAGAIAAVAGWVAAVALVSLLALRPAPFAPGAAPLPGYTLAMHVGDGHGPRAPDAEPRVDRGARLTIALTPEHHVHAPVEVKFCLVRDGNAHPWPVAVDLDGSGGARISGTREALFEGVAAGAWEVVAVIGQPGALPTCGEELPDEDAVRASGGQVLRQRLLLD